MVSTSQCSLVRLSNQIPTIFGRSFVRRRGTASVELVVVIIPLLLILFNCLEFSRFAQSKMVLQHAATAGVRSCAVTRDTYNPGIHGPVDDYKRAVTAALGPWRTSNRLRGVQYPGGCVEPANPKDENGMLRLKISADYSCGYPLTFCRAIRARDGVVKLTAEATFPKQGAKYDVQYSSGSANLSNPNG